MKREKIIVKKNKAEKWQVFVVGSNGEKLYHTGDGYENKKDALAVVHFMRWRAWLAKLVIEG